MSDYQGTARWAALPVPIGDRMAVAEVRTSLLALG